MMATYIFSIFDPSTSLISLNWTSMIIPLIIFPYPMWLIPSRSMSIINIITKTISKEFNILMNNFKPISKTPFMLMVIMMFIAINNYMGLFPYIFTASSHIMITLMLALPIWMSAIIFGWINHTLHMWAHMVPQGTPKPLMMFMVCIETISVMIRPITLAVRLAANMIAGHLLITLLGNFTMESSLYSKPIMLMIQNLLLILEWAVAIIQSYVFAVLVGLYITESHH